MKKAIVIGATSGIGRETAARLVEAGWMVGDSGAFYGHPPGVCRDSHSRPRQEISDDDITAKGSR